MSDTRVLTNNEEANLRHLFNTITEAYKKGNLPLFLVTGNAENENMGYVLVNGVPEEIAQVAVDAVIAFMDK